MDSGDSMISPPYDSPHDCILCGAMLDDGRCGVCGVVQEKARLLIEEESRKDFLDLCETAKTSADADTRTLFRKLSESRPAPLGWRPRRRRQIDRARRALSSTLFSLTNPAYQALICRAYQVVELHNAWEQLRRYLIPSALISLASFGMARWLTEGSRWQVVLWPVLAIFFLTLAEKPLEYLLNRFAKPLSPTPDAAEVPLHLSQAVSERVRVPWYLTPLFWWPVLITASVITVSLF
jgi:hypothetical protein